MYICELLNKFLLMFNEYIEWVSKKKYFLPENQFLFLLLS